MNTSTLTVSPIAHSSMNLKDILIAVLKEELIAEGFSFDGNVPKLQEGKDYINLNGFNNNNEELNKILTSTIKYFIVTSSEISHPANKPSPMKLWERGGRMTYARGVRNCTVFNNIKVTQLLMALTDGTLDNATVSYAAFN